MTHPTELQYLWIGALCINQDDIPERDHQVGLMSRIYSPAGMVLVWLRPASRSTSNKTGWPADLTNEHNYEEMRSILSRPYWTRLWILQEIVLAKSITVICGESTLVPSKRLKTLKDLWKNTPAFATLDRHKRWIKVVPEESDQRIHQSIN